MSQIGRIRQGMDVLAYLLPFLAIVLSVGVTLLAHEATHLCVGQLIGEPSVSIESWIPFRLKVDFGDESVSPTGIRLLAVAPALTGILLAGLFLFWNGFTWLTKQDPYYTSRISILYWILYSHISPADFRTFVSPFREDGRTY